MPIISVRGFFDTHVHTGPAPIKRLGDTADIGRWCAEAGMAGIVVKSHFESTIAKVHHARKEVPGLQFFASIGLNRGVGGVNPGAVEQALGQGASVVWFPTVDSRNHIRYFGTGGYFGSTGAASYPRKEAHHLRSDLTVIKNGKLTADAKDVIDLVVAHGAVLATGHIDRKEIMAVVDYALGKNHQKVVVTHPEQFVPGLDLETQVELANAGCFMEYCAINCMPVFDCVSVKQLKEMIEAVTPKHAILATDSGQPFTPKTPEMFRIFVQMLYDVGVSSDAITQMVITNPAGLLTANLRNDSVEFDE